MPLQLIGSCSERDAVSLSGFLDRSARFSIPLYLRALKCRPSTADAARVPRSGFPGQARLTPAGFRAPCLLLLALAGLAQAQDNLSLAEAERIALARDPGVAGMLASGEALSEEAVAAAELPDPRLKLGAVAIPIDTFDLDQEPMTQVQVGVVQSFPPGNTLALQGRALAQRAQAFAARAEDQRLKILQAVRRDYAALQGELQTAAHLRDTLASLEQLRDLVTDYYSTGRAQQQEVFRAEVEMLRIEERLARVMQSEQMIRARLSTWLGDQAWKPLPSDRPKLPSPMAQDQLIENLPNHPAVNALQAEIEAAQTAVSVSREQYKPGLSIDLTYGERSGRNMDGAHRPDFLSAMLMVDLPIFRDRRQDRRLAASSHRLAAAEAQRADLLRELRASAQGAYAQLERLERRLALYQERLLPQAQNSTDAARDAYQAAVGDLTALMRAEITAYELQLDHARLSTEHLQTLARIHYLEGRR